MWLRDALVQALVVLAAPVANASVSGRSRDGTCIPLSEASLGLVHVVLVSAYQYVLSLAVARVQLLTCSTAVTS